MLKSKSSGILAVLVAAAVGLGLFLVASEPALRIPFALPLIFFLPGHAVLEAVLPEDPKGLLRFVFAVGLSLAIVVLGGLALNLVPAMTRWGWISFLGAVTAAGYFIALARRIRSGHGALSRLPGKWKLSVKDAALYSGTVATVILAFMISSAEGQKYQQVNFTEFWMMPDRTDEIGTVELGMRNAESQAASYDVELMLGGQMIAAWRNISLQKSESWRRTIDLPGSSRKQRLDAWLFKSGDHRSVYRRVWLDSRDPT